MTIRCCKKTAFCVIGKEGTTEDGTGFIQKLWEQANAHFMEVQAMVKRDDNGNPVGFWGAMSDFSLSFLPWEDNFSRGRYLAGVECQEDAQPPEGWTKWQIPGFEYLVVKCETEHTFSDMIDHLSENQIPLAGAVHDFTCPATGENYMFFPVKKL